MRVPLALSWQSLRCFGLWWRPLRQQLRRQRALAWGLALTLLLALGGLGIQASSGMGQGASTQPGSRQANSRQAVSWQSVAPSVVTDDLTPARENLPVGMFVTQLYNFRPAASSFDAEFWLWSQTLADGTNALDSSSFANAYAARRSPPDTTVVPEEAGDKRIVLEKVRGTFHHDWRLVHFPFDRQFLQIFLEEDERDASLLRLVPDRVNSSVDAEIPGEWRVVRFALNNEERHYHSSFGAESNSANPRSSYSRLVMTIELARTSVGPLWRLCAAPLAAVVIVLLTYFMHQSTPGALPGRCGLIGASLFAEIISLRAVSGPVDNGGPLTLIEALHLLAIIYTLVAAVITALIGLLQSRSIPSERLNRWDRRAALITTLLLLPPVIALFIDAIHWG